jgi:hypothetical protein
VGGAGQRSFLAKKREEKGHSEDAVSSFHMQWIRKMQTNRVCEPTSLRREEKEFLWAVRPDGTLSGEQIVEVCEAFQGAFLGRDIDPEALMEFYNRFEETVSPKASKAKKVLRPVRAGAL